MHEEMVKEIGSGLGLLTVRQVAEYCAVDPDTVRENWIKTGIEIEGRLVKLVAIRVGGSWRIERRSLVEFLLGCNPGASASSEASPRKKEPRKSSGPTPEELQRLASRRLSRK
jgi:hypothetical protein